MIILDTNVISEFMRLEPCEDVLCWIRRHEPQSLFTTSVTQAEMLFGIAVMPHGRRRNAFQLTAEKVFKNIFAGRILPFDTKAADRYVEVMYNHRKSGRQHGQADAQIAAIALVHEAMLATRNSKDFEGCGIPLVDPWQG